MAERPAGDQRGGSMDTEQDLLLQREQPATREYRVISSPGSSRGAASLSLAATAAPALGAKRSGYYSENGYLMKLSRQERQRIEQEIKKRFKPGETWLSNSCGVNAPTCTCIRRVSFRGGTRPPLEAGCPLPLENCHKPYT